MIDRYHDADVAVELRPGGKAAELHQGALERLIERLFRPFRVHELELVPTEADLTVAVAATQPLVEPADIGWRRVQVSVCVLKSTCEVVEQHNALTTVDCSVLAVHEPCAAARRPASK